MVKPTGLLDINQLRFKENFAIIAARNCTKAFLRVINGKYLNTSLYLWYIRELSAGSKGVKYEVYQRYD